MALLKLRRIAASHIPLLPVCRPMGQKGHYDESNVVPCIMYISNCFCW